MNDMVLALTVFQIFLVAAGGYLIGRRQMLGWLVAALNGGLILFNIFMHVGR